MLYRSPTSRLIITAVPSAVVLSACTGSPSVYAPASPESGQILGLFWGVIALSGVIFLIVEGLLIFAVLRFRSRPGLAEPNQVQGNLRLEIAWTLAPTLVVVGLFVAMVQPMYAIMEQKPGALRAKVTGHQWWWLVEYPDLGITTAGELRVPVGRPVEVELVAADVIHSFWAPELFGKVDVLPRHSTLTRFTASKTGVFRGQCAEFCGVQHANMGFLVIAEPQDEFDEWVKRSQAPPAAVGGYSIARGQTELLLGACMGCHTVKGTQAQGKLGPDLTHFGSRRSIGSLTMELTPENLASWLTDPQAVKPGSKMPNLRLSQETIQDLVTFLMDLK